MLQATKMWLFYSISIYVSNIIFLTDMIWLEFEVAWISVLCRNGNTFLLATQKWDPNSERLKSTDLIFT